MLDELTKRNDSTRFAIFLEHENTELSHWWNVHSNTDIDFISEEYVLIDIESDSK